MTRTQLINAIIAKNKYRHYLEIGMGTGKNFSAIRCQNKISVDPDKNTRATFHMTSTDYFNSSVGKFNCIFIDGLHHQEQAREDLILSWSRLEPGGTVVLHDTNPYSEHITHVPRDNKEWCGNVYKLICQIANPKFTYSQDYGVTVLKNTGEGLVLSDSIITWEEFDKNRIELLNLKTWEESLQLI